MIYSCCNILYKKIYTSNGHSVCFDSGNKKFSIVRYRYTKLSKVKNLFFKKHITIFYCFQSFGQFRIVQFDVQYDLVMCHHHSDSLLDCLASFLSCFLIILAYKTSSGVYQSGCFLNLLIIFLVAFLSDKSTLRFV